MNLHLPFPRHNRTVHVRIDTALCKACGHCVASCPQQVLGMIAILRHRHVHVDRAANCKGCARCVRICTEGAIRRQPIIVVQNRETSV